MNWKAVSFDWNHIRAFLAVAQEGSLSAAARALSAAQPTLSRQIRALEAHLGVGLFDRVGRSLVLTPVGRDLLEHVQVMGDAATRLSLAASGQSSSIKGHVVLGCSDAVGAYLLPPLLDRLGAEAPDLTVEIVASNEVSNLQRREADIAIRHVRPAQPDLIARLVKQTTAHLYATPEYLDGLGRPGAVSDLTAARFVGFDRSNRLLEHLNALGAGLAPDQFRLVSNSGVVGWEMVRAGLGIGVMMHDIAALSPTLEPVLADQISIPVPIWLVTHQDLRTSRRIRLVFDLLAAHLSGEAG